MTSLDGTSINTQSDVIGFNEESNNVVYLRVKKNGRIFEVPDHVKKMSEFMKGWFDDCDPGSAGYSKDQPLEILDNMYITEDTIEFVIEYINLYKDKDEIEHPAKPLKSKILNCIFNDEECKLFSKLILEEKDGEDGNTLRVKRHKHINPYIMTANYLALIKLLQKLCSVVASYIKGVPVNDLVDEKKDDVNV